MRRVDRTIASAIRALLDGKIDFGEYLLLVPEDTDDEQLAELLDLVEHIPRRNGIFGVSEEELAKYFEKIQKMLAELDERTE